MKYWIIENFDIKYVTKGNAYPSWHQGNIKEISEETYLKFCEIIR